MAVTNTGIVLRTITGVNESDLFLDSEATSVTTNIGIVERSIVGVHDANFVRPLGDEETTNGDFSNGSTGWELSGAANVSNGVGNFVGSGDKIIQRPNFTQGKLYKITFDILNYTSGTSRVYLGSTGDASFTATANGTYSVILEAEGTSDVVQWRSDGGSTFIGSIDNVSVKEMLVTRESTTTNTGIVERAITGLNESVAFRQDTRTNLITYSEDFSDASWNASSDVIIDKGYLAPDGTNNATKITVNGANPKAALLITASTIVTKSIYARTVSGTGTVYLGEGNINGVLSNVTEQWQRFEVTNNKTAFYAADFRGASTLTEVIVWGAQFEELSHATSYISTNGATVTVDSNSTSVVNNTGIVERPITGVNESDPMFPDNTISNIVNIAGLISSLLADLEARATTFENREATQNILINLQKC